MRCDWSKKTFVQREAKKQKVSMLTKSINTSRIKQGKLGEGRFYMAFFFLRRTEIETPSDRM